MTLETKRLLNLLEGTVDGRPDGDTLVEVNGGKSALADALRSELEFLRKKSVYVIFRKVLFRLGWTYSVDLLVRSRGTEAVQTELLVRVALPAHGRANLNGEDRDSVGKNLELVLLVLSIEDLEAGHRDNASNNAVVLLQVSSSVETDADFGTSGDDGDGGVRSLKDGVSTLESSLNAGVHELGQVLASESQDGGGVLSSQGRVVSSAGLVTIRRAPDHTVGESTEVSQSLDRLVGGAILTQTDGVVGSDVNDANAREGRETDGTGGVGDEVQEGTSSGDDGTVGSETVHDSSHGVLTDTVAEVTARPFTNAVLRRLEVNSSLPAGVVGASQIGRARQKLGDDRVDLLENSLRELAGGNGGVGGLVDRERLLPALRELAGETAGEVSVLLREFSGILLEELVPLLLLSSTLISVLLVEVIDLLGNHKALGRVETEELLNALDVVGLERVTVDTASALKLGTETNGGGQADHSGLVLDGLGLLDGSLDALKVVVTVLDPNDVPAVGLKALADILGESALGVTI